MVTDMIKTKLTNEDISNLCLSLSMLLHAGIGTGDGLSLLAEDETRPQHKALIAFMAEKADQGQLLSGILRESGSFPAYACGLIEVGEETGRLEEALSSLAGYYEERMRLERQIRSALLYPALLLLIMLAVIVVLLVKVLPVFDSVYGQLGSRLTGIAGGLLAFGQVLDQLMPVLLAVLAAVVVFLAFFAGSQGFRGKILRIWNVRRGGRGLTGKVNMARTAQVLAMGMNSGLPVEESLHLASVMAEDVPEVRERCQACAADLEQGVPLAQALRQHGVLPQTECRLLEAGMKGGLGDSAMSEISRCLLEESEEAISAKVSQVEPALVMVTSVLVGLILLSVMLPLVHIMAAIG